MNRDTYIDLYTQTLKVKWLINKCFHTTASKIFKSEGWYFDSGPLHAREDKIYSQKVWQRNGQEKLL